MKKMKANEQVVDAAMSFTPARLSSSCAEPQGTSLATSGTSTLGNCQHQLSPDGDQQVQGISGNTMCISPHAGPVPYAEFANHAPFENSGEHADIFVPLEDPRNIAPSNIMPFSYSHSDVDFLNGVNKSVKARGISNFRLEHLIPHSEYFIHVPNGFFPHLQQSCAPLQAISSSNLGSQNKANWAPLCCLFPSCIHYNSTDPRSEKDKAIRKNGIPSPIFLSSTSETTFKSSENLPLVSEGVSNKSWGLHDNVVVQPLKFNVFLVKFQDGEDKEKAWSYRPWSAQGYHLLLQLWKEGGAVEKMPLDRTLFWFQVHGIPTAFISEEKAIKIGKTFGENEFFDIFIILDSSVDSIESRGAADEQAPKSK